MMAAKKPAPAKKPITYWLVEWEETNTDVTLHETEAEALDEVAAADPVNYREVRLLEVQILNTYRIEPSYAKGSKV